MEYEKPLVSIIIPVYNSRRTLDRCIRSILNQTYDNWEIIIVDSDSDDNTSEICHKWIKKIGINKIRYFKINERFQAAKRNFGAYVAKGSYLFFLDSDQYMTSTILEECIKFISQNKNYKAISFPEKRVWMNQGYLAKSLFILREAVMEKSDITHEGIPRFISKDIYLQVGGQDTKLNYVEDTDFNFKLRENKIIWKLLPNYLIHDENVSFSWLIYKPYYSYPAQIMLAKKWLGKFNVGINPKSRLNAYKKLIYVMTKNAKYVPGILFIMFVRAFVRRLALLAYVIYNIL